MKKRILNILIALIFPFVGMSQLTVIYGYVKSNTTNLGIANHQVTIKSQIDTSTSTGMNYYSSVFTASNGFFLDSVTVPTGQNIIFQISTFDCQNNIVTDSFYSFTPSPVNLSICDSNLASCLADFVAYADTSNYKNFHFYNLSLNNYTSNVWYFGDGDSSLATNPNHIYSSDGFYPVSLTVYDSVTGCTNTKYDTVNVSPTFYCSNSFTYSANNLDVNFFGSVNNTLPTIYKWNFGDFSIATGQNPVHIFSNAGIYKVCLQTISVNPLNMDTCIASSCQYISVQAPPSGNIWGQVFRDSLRVDAGQVILYQYQSAKNIYVGFDTVDVTVIDSINLSFYYFERIPYGKYITKAFLKKQSVTYFDFGPAYFGNSFKWNNTPAFTLNKAGIDKPIHLTHIYTPLGLAMVEGKVLEGSQKNPGDPVANVLLYLYDVQGDVYGYTYSDVDGNYSFIGLEYKKYYIYADVLNKGIFPAYVWPDEGHHNLTDINIYIGTEKVTSIQEESVIEAKVFPNPADEMIQIQLNVKEDGDYKFVLLNNLGQIVLSTTKELNRDSQTVKMDLNSLSSGVYNLLIYSPTHNSSAIKIVITH